MLRVLQINLHHSSSASAELLLTLGEGKFDVVLIQEPWVSASGQILGLRTHNFNLFNSETEGRKRTAILTSKKLNTYLKSNFSTNDCTVVACEGGQEPLLLASTYMSHDRNAPPEEVQQLVEESYEKGLKLVIGGDANAHHTVWGSKDVNERGESLLQYILNTNLVIANRGEVPTYKGPTSSNVLDITLCTDSERIEIVDWKVLEKPSLSDHSYISFGITHNPVLVSKSFRNPEKANWELFTKLVDDKLGGKCPTSISDTKHLESTVNFFSHTLCKVFEVSCPIRKPRKRKQPPWWSAELRISRRHVHELFKAAKATDRQEAWGQYREALKTFKKDLRYAKRNSWRDFCGNIEKTTETARLRKIISKNPSTPTLLRNNEGAWTNSSRETLEVLMSTHFPGCLSANEPAVFPESRTSNRLECVPGLITNQRINWAISSFSPYKSPGPDGIIPAMLIKAQELVVPWLKIIFKSCLKLNYVPESWRTAKAVFIPKGGRSSHIDPKDYRPISLTSFLLKTLERLMDSYIRENLTPGVLSKAQHAYQKGRSVDTALHDVVFEIEKALSFKEYALGLFLDIEGAFNNVTSQAIMEALHSAGVHPTICTWINSMIECRFITSEWMGAHLNIKAQRGTPQGGVLSPLLWVFVTNRILRKLESEGIKVVAYADDLVLLVSGKYLNTISELTERALAEISSWANDKGLNVNAQKTELVLFTRKYKIPAFRTPSLGGTQLPLKTHAKYLGLTLDSKLTWKLNVDERVKKACNAFYACKKMLGRTWGLKPHITHWVYTAIVRPILLYGVLVWWPALEKKTYAGRLERVQRLAGLGITGALSTTPTSALNTILHLPPVDLVAKNVATKTALRLKEAGVLKTRPYGHSGLGIDMSVNTDYLVPTMCFNRKFTINIPSRQQWQEGPPTALNAIEVYTDGSKMEKGVGAAVHCPKLNINRSFALPDYCSIFQAEVLAIQKAAELICNSRTANSRVYLFIDSQAAIKALGSCTVRSKIVLSCLSALDRLCANRKVQLCWVPGHMDIDGNEAADALAKEGASLESHLAERVLPPIQKIKTEQDELMMELAQKRWSALTSCRTAKAIWGSYDKGKTDALLTLSRPECRTVVGITTGHCLVGAHALKLKLVSSDTCRKCEVTGEKETVEHLLCHCPALARTRLRLMGEPWIVDLKHIEEQCLRTILRFAKETDAFVLNRHSSEQITTDSSQRT